MSSSPSFETTTQSGTLYPGAVARTAELKILIYSSVFHPSIGGIENLTLALANEFSRLGHQVKVVTEQVQDPDAPLEGMEVVHASRLVQQLRLFFWCDVVYMPNITLKGVWLFLFNPFKKWVISHNDFHLSIVHNRKTRLKNLVLKGGARSVSVSRSVARSLPVGSRVIYNCYNDAVFKVYADERRDVDFIFVGRLVSQKGCDLLIRACSRLNRPFRLSIVGDGPECAKLSALVQALGLQDSIRFLGFMRDEQLARTMNRHRVMVVPSVGVEGFGIVALEGLACGCKMLVAEAGGLPEAVGEFGETFPMGDAKALTALLERSLEQRESAPMADAKASFLRAHTVRSVARKYLEVLA